MNGLSKRLVLTGLLSVSLLDKKTETETETDKDQLFGLCRSRSWLVVVWLGSSLLLVLRTGLSSTRHEHSAPRRGDRTAILQLPAMATHSRNVSIKYCVVWTLDWCLSQEATFHCQAWIPKKGSCCDYTHNCASNHITPTSTLPLALSHSDHPSGVWSSIKQLFWVWTVRYATRSFKCVPTVVIRISIGVR